MWKLPDAVAQRFPLVARPRPACLPLPQRVHTLAELADTAAKLDHTSMASTVYNQAALIASDIGDPDAARTMCHQHAAAYLHAAPCPPRPQSGPSNPSSTSRASKSAPGSTTKVANSSSHCSKLSAPSPPLGSKTSPYQPTSPRTPRTVRRSAAGSGGSSSPTEHEH